MKLMVLDGNSIVNRAYYGVRPLTTQDGTPTNAIYGFLNILLRLMEEEKPDALCVTFDLPAPTFRHLAYAGYKANRKGMPEELAVQMPLLKEVLAAMNIPRYELEGWEADDLLGTIAARCTAEDWQSVIVTGDRDSLQLIGERTTVKLVSTRMGQTTTRDMTPESFRAEYGFDPIHIIDLKALMGDSSDNIPGVKGVGEKTAMALVSRYGSIDALYAAAPEIEMAPGEKAKPGVITKLTEGESDARMSYDLATIRTDAPLAFSPRDALRRDADNDALYALFLRLEFSRLIDRLGLTAPEEEAEEGESFAGVCTTRKIRTAGELASCLDDLCARGDVLCLRASEELDLIVFQSEGREDEALILDETLYEDDYPAALRSVLSPEIPKASHCVKELSRAALRRGVPGGGWVFDSAVAAYLLDATAGSYDLDRLFLKYCGARIGRATEAVQENVQLSLLSEEDGSISRAARQNDLAAEMSAVSALREKLEPELKKNGMWELFTGVELPLCTLLAEMEHTGMLVDREALSGFGRMLDECIAADVDTIYALAGETFNINSTQQLGHVLFDKLGLPPVKKTKSGWSTNAEVLEKLRGSHPIVDTVLEYRQYAKLKSTYVDGLGKVIADDGRIHTSFQNTVTATGRLSSAEPNLQNIPVRTELGAEMRKMFVAPEGSVLVDADYSQIELRLLAHIAGDERMIAAFRSGEDIHTVTASQVFGVPFEEVTHEMRRRAKAVNFGIVYGISAFSLAQDIGVTNGEAKDYIERYLSKYSGVRAYMSDIVAQAKRDGFVSTLYGRRRDLPELRSSNFNLRSFGERVALNMPIQGTAADIMKMAMLRVDARLKAGGLAAKLILQVHDELIVECPAGEEAQVRTILSEEMEKTAALSVPLTADAGAGRTWAESKN